MRTCAAFLTLLLTLFGAPVSGEEAIVTGPDRRGEIDLRIEDLDARRAEISTKGPQIVTLFGLLLSLAGGATVGITVGDCKYRDQEECAFGALMAGAGMAGIGIITAIGGGVVLGVRAHQRNEIDAERESLIEERDGLAATLSRLELRSPYRDGTRFVTLGVRF